MKETGNYQAHVEPALLLSESILRLKKERKPEPELLKLTGMSCYFRDITLRSVFSDSSKFYDV